MNPPELPATLAARAFIRSTALLSLAMAGISVLWSLLQLLIVLLTKPSDLLEIMQLMLPPDADSPPLMLWIAQYALLLSALLLGLSLAFAWVSWGLLKYRHWGRIGFIVFLIIIALANFALLPLCDRLFTDSMAALFSDGLWFSSNEGNHWAAHIQRMRWFMWISLGSTMLLVAALHGWLIVKLQRRQMRALFY